MARDPRYKSSIPSTAKERIVERHPDGPRMRAEYFVGQALVGTRYWDQEGHLAREVPLKNGRWHGTEYTWYFDGILTSAEPFLNGVAHGVAKQWAEDGTLIGQYRMVHGTGIDLWYAESYDRPGASYLSEVLHFRDGVCHGVRWSINEDQKTIHFERYYHQGPRHGIEREWNREGRLARGFPQYYVNGNRVTKRQYLRACENDPTLPPFRLRDNLPQRTFPKEIRQHLRPPR